MTEPSPILQRILSLWNAPMDRRRPGQKKIPYHRDSAIAPSTVIQALRNDFSDLDIQTALQNHLENVSSVYERGGSPNDLDIFLADCDMEILESSVATFHVSKTMIERVVKVFPSIIWYSPIGSLCEVYLTDLEIIEALREGLKREANAQSYLSNIEGLRLYRNLGKKDPRIERMNEVKQGIRQRLSELTHHDDDIVRKMAHSASDSLVGWGSTSDTKEDTAPGESPQET